LSSAIGVNPEKGSVSVSLRPKNKSAETSGADASGADPPTPPSTPAGAPPSLAIDTGPDAKKIVKPSSLKKVSIVVAFSNVISGTGSGVSKGDPIDARDAKKVRYTDPGPRSEPSGITNPCTPGGRGISNEEEFTAGTSTGSLQSDVRDGRVDTQMSRPPDVPIERRSEANQSVSPSAEIVLPVSGLRELTERTFCGGPKSS